MASNQALQKSLSFERLSKFRVAPNEPDSTIYSRYLWNIELSEAFHPILHGLEVTFRNRLYTEISSILGPNWIDPHSTFLATFERNSIIDAQRVLQQNGANPQDIPKLIAELKFGFWTSLLNRKYEYPATRLWPKLVQAFPNTPRNEKTRQGISSRFNAIRKLRNRVFHYEPIWHWSDLPRHHAQIVEAIEWMDPHAKELFCSIDRFTAVFTRGLAALPFPVTTP